MNKMQEDLGEDEMKGEILELYLMLAEAKNYADEIAHQYRELYNDND
jgi:hypothetical protein